MGAADGPHMERPGGVTGGCAGLLEQPTDVSHVRQVRRPSLAPTGLDRSLFSSSYVVEKSDQEESL